MTTTHAFVGAAIGLAVATVTPAPSMTALLVGGVGGALPDADLLATHRRSLHYPVGFGCGAILATGIALATATPVATLGAVFFVAIAVHCTMDVFGGGVGPRPWEARSNRGVYNHLAGRWIRPRRWVRYAGAPEDLGLAAVVGLPVLVWAGGRARFVIAGLLVCSIVFSLYRRRFAVLDEHVATDA